MSATNTRDGHNMQKSFQCDQTVDSPFTSMPSAGSPALMLVLFWPSKSGSLTVSTRNANGGELPQGFQLPAINIQDSFRIFCKRKNPAPSFGEKNSSIKEATDWQRFLLAGSSYSNEEQDSLLLSHCLAFNSEPKKDLS